MRMYGYDSPEMKPPLKQENREAIIDNAKKAQAFLASIILNKVLLAERIKHPKHENKFLKDKYGRILVQLYAIDSSTGKINTDSINDTMLREKYGYHYYGGKKEVSQ